MTFDLFPPPDCTPTESSPMSSPAASPASRTALPESVAPEPTSATCGPSSPASFARLGRDGCWQKTCQGYVQANLDGSLEEYSETWPAQGMMRSGAAFPLPMSERHTSATASGSWPTPRVEPGNFSRVNGKIYETSLQSMARRGLMEMWPTPTAEDGESKGMSAKRLATRAPDNLATAVRFPSPAARDWRSGQGRSENGHTPQLLETVSGQLNARFVEWLMGLPDNWTDVSGSSD